MKLTDKFSAAQLKAPTWDLYDQCSATIGVILDNKFKDPHIKVYEHIRHTSSEVFRHPEYLGESPPYHYRENNGLAKEENEILGTLLTPEVGRRLNIVGDVGVGKTTFVKHLMAVHLGTPEICPTQPIYVDFADFNASIADPIIDIRQKFVDTVWSELERMFGLEKLGKIDEIVFEKAKIFATARAITHRLPEHSKSASITTAMQDALKNNSVKYTIERLNALSEDNFNRLLLIIDNIDHLPGVVLRSLSGFLLEVQLDATPMLIVCMRDHTYLSGFSSYREDKTVPSWNFRLKPPNLRLMLDRRINHFFPPDTSETQSQTVSTGSGILRIDRSLSKVCRALLKSPLTDQETYEFICAYTNYNIRDLFANLQRIVGFSGYRGHDKSFFLEDEPKLIIGIDECLVALALGDSLLFFPQRSPIFNPYSAGEDNSPLDRIVAGRILQLLDNRVDWMPFKGLKLVLIEWGYTASAIESQVRAMINKDIIWTSTGAPLNFRDESEIRLSYRGQLYARKILRRTVFNYMMSFDAEAPSESHAVFRHHKGEFRSELEAFASFSTTATLESDALTFRVLGLAELIFESEKLEIRQLVRKKEMHEFKVSVAPKSLSVGIIDGLTKFLQKTYEKNENGSRSRFMPPSTATLKTVGETQDTYKKAFVGVFD